MSYNLILTDIHFNNLFISQLNIQIILYNFRFATFLQYRFYELIKCVNIFFPMFIG
jgi:hypothetical protein